MRVCVEVCEYKNTYEARASVYVVGGGAREGEDMRSRSEGMRSSIERRSRACAREGEGMRSWSRGGRGHAVEKRVRVCGRGREEGEGMQSRV